MIINKHTVTEQYMNIGNRKNLLKENARWRQWTIIWLKNYPNRGIAVSVKPITLIFQSSVEQKLPETISEHFSSRTQTNIQRHYNDSTSTSSDCLCHVVSKSFISAVLKQHHQMIAPTTSSVERLICLISYLEEISICIIMSVIQFRRPDTRKSWGSSKFNIKRTSPRMCQINRCY